MYFEGKKHGLEIVRKSFGVERTETQWREGKNTEFNGENKVVRIERYEHGVMRELEIWCEREEKILTKIKY